jgi:hypothetical protein
MRRIYVASSWRNPRQPGIVAALRDAGHEVYDFRNPAPGERGFHWSAIEPRWQDLSMSAFRDVLQHPVAEHGFGLDWGAMSWADTGVLVLPCGRSAHLEAGYFVGALKPLLILLAPDQEPELMYKMAWRICLDLDDLIDALASLVAGTGRIYANVSALASGGRSG